METIRRRGLELGLGLGLAIALVLAVVVIYQSFSGAYSDDITVSAMISRAGDALEQGDIVTYRDVIVGEVTDATGNLDGSAALKLKIHRNDAAVIPANVTAVAIPASLFGSTKIVLVPGADLTGPHLGAGQRIGADRSPAAESLQTALADAYALLTAVHPAQLDAALSALASALEGQGENVGQLISSADSYLTRLAPSLPALDDVITSLVTVTGEVAKNSPELLSSLGNVLTVAAGVEQSKQAVADLLGIAPTAVGNAQLLLSPTNVDNAVTILRDQVPVLGALGADPRALPATINGFKQFADTFSGALSSGPYAKVNIILTGANLAALFNVAVGGKGTVFSSVSDPPGYTAADCPSYPGAAGLNCAAAASAQSQGATVLDTGAAYGGTSSSIGSPREIAAVNAAATAITGQPSSLPSVVDLLLGPLLRGTPTVVMTP